MYGLDKDEHRSDLGSGQKAQWPETKKEEADEFTAGRSCFVNVGRCEDKRGTRSSGAETVFSSLFAFFFAAVIRGLDLCTKKQVQPLQSTQRRKTNENSCSNFIQI